MAKFAFEIAALPDKLAFVNASRLILISLPPTCVVIPGPPIICKVSPRFTVSWVEDVSSILKNELALPEVKPTEIYNLGAQSHVKVSFEMPEYTSNCFKNS